MFYFVHLKFLLFDIGIGFKGLYLLFPFLLIFILFKRCLLHSVYVNYLLICTFLVFLFFFSSLFAYSHTIAIIASCYRAIFWFSVLIFALYFTCFKIDLKSIFNTILLFLFISSLYSIAQYLLYMFYGYSLAAKIPFQKFDFEPVVLSLHTRVSGFMNGPSEFGVIIASIVPFTLKMALVEKRYIYLLYFFVFTLTIILTLSRTAFLAYAVALFCVFLFFKIKIKYKVYFFTSFIFLFICLLFSPIGQYFFFRFDFSEGYNFSSTQGHAKYASAAIQAWSNSPYFGVGVGNFEYYAQNNIFHDNSAAMTHSAYLEFLAEQGSIGFILNLLIICWILKLSYCNIDIFLGYVTFLSGNFTYQVYNCTFNALLISICLYGYFHRQSTYHKYI